MHLERIFCLLALVSTSFAVSESPDWWGKVLFTRIVQGAPLYNDNSTLDGTIYWDYTNQRILFEGIRTQYERNGNIISQEGSGEFRTMFFVSQMYSP